MPTTHTAPSILSVSHSSLSEEPKVPKLRLHVMRTLFFLNFLSLFIDNWSAILFPSEPYDVFSGVSISFWASFALLNLLGIRFPLKLLPLLLLQFFYKSAWIIGTYLPAKRAGLLNEDLESFLWVCVAGIVLNLLIIPWTYVYREYLRGLFILK